MRVQQPCVRGYICVCTSGLQGVPWPLARLGAARPQPEGLCPHAAGHSDLLQRARVARLKEPAGWGWGEGPGLHGGGTPRVTRGWLRALSVGCVGDGAETRPRP